MTENNYIFIKGAREHNLKNLTLKIPRNKMVVITGISGSGKSSLAFDTIYAEGQRRYIESLSSYARQFLGVLEKPDVDYIEGLSPAIAIEQRTAAKNPRSTVGTVTEIYDYLRVLFARLGKPFCPYCNKEIASQTLDQIIDQISSYPENTKLIILAPVVRGRKGEYQTLLEKIKKRGFLRVRVDGKIYEISEVKNLEKYKKHNIEILIDRLVLLEENKKRLADSIELALKEGQGLCVVIFDEKEEKIFSEKFACVDCGFSYEEISPRLFSFNSPYGACSACHGLGTKMEIDPERLIVDPKLSINEGVIEVWGEPKGRWFTSVLKALAKNYGFSLNTPWEKLPKKVKEIILYGSNEEILVEHERWDGTHYKFYEEFEGVIPHLMRIYQTTESESTREWIERYMSILPCPECGGARLKKEALSVKINGYSIYDICRLSIRECYQFFDNLKLNEQEKKIAQELINEIKKRLNFLIEVGVDYLTLERRTDTLGGGEEQRVRLATQIGSGLVGVTYILDEPSIGLHMRDNHKLIQTLLRLRDLGNTVIVVEHDRDTILASDYVIDLGPGAGEKGGYIVATGTPEEIMNNPNSLTGAYLSGKREIPLPEKRRKGNGKFLIVKGCSENNLKNIDVTIPLGMFVCLTGVSGSGKSTFMNDILYKALAEKFYGSREKPGKFKEIIGWEEIDKVVNIDQSPIGRTPRSNPATYTNVFTPIRELFAQTKEAKMRGYSPGRFSFNVRGGRCENCGGDGIKKIEMHFLPDVYVTCEVCKGKRYNRETLEIRYKGKNIYDVLEMTVNEALEFFYNIPAIRRKLEMLRDVGLGYIKLGQPATTLSGGEAQRVKLARELSKIGTGKTLYLLDEPTTGLHFEDIRLLLIVLNRLVDKGNTVLVIEHNLDVIKCADWIIDLGPEGGENGGYIVACGTPEEIARCEKSYTGKFLREVLRRHGIQF
uniref:UvrABC system protein A n=1 Tax=candidate division WOR-3 bacterium TaxID=2052148 RepID=A0A7V3ZVR4_UNCW3